MTDLLYISHDLVAWLLRGVYAGLCLAWIPIDKFSRFRILRTKSIFAWVRLGLGVGCYFVIFEEKLILWQLWPEFALTALLLSAARVILRRKVRNNDSFLSSTRK